MSSPPAGEDRPLLEFRNRPLLMLAVVLVSMCQFFDATIANVALPYMKASLGASTELVSWVLTCFIMATAIATPICGWLSDRVGSRNLFMYATLLFLVSSAACGAAPSLTAMIVFRTIQGISAAFIGPMTMTILFDISPPSKQASTMAIFGMMMMVAPISGPAIGGFITEYMNWRWIYYVNLPLGIPALALIWWLLPSRPIERRKLDLFGFAAIAIALAAMQLAFDRGQSKDWLTSKEIVAELIIMLSAFWIFIIHSRGHPYPLFKRALYTNANFVASLVSMMVMGASVVGLSAVLPMMFQSIYNYPVIDTGLLMAPRGLGVMCTSTLSGYLARKTDFRVVISCGYLVVAMGMWLMTKWSLDMDSTPILMAGFVQGLGFGLIVTPMQLVAFTTLDPRCARTADLDVPVPQFWRVDRHFGNRHHALAHPADQPCRYRRECHVHVDSRFRLDRHPRPHGRHGRGGDGGGQWRSQSTGDDDRLPRQFLHSDLGVAVNRSADVLAQEDKPRWPARKSGGDGMTEHLLQGRYSPCRCQRILETHAKL